MFKRLTILRYVTPLVIAALCLSGCTKLIKPESPTRSTGRIAGALVNDGNNPAQQVKVQLYPVASSETTESTTPLKETKTDEQGKFSFEGLASANYFVIAESASGFRAQISAAVGTDQDKNIGTLVLKMTGNIFGKVILAQQKSADGVSVYVPGTSYIAISNTQGDFKLSNVPEGIYSVKYSKNGFSEIVASDIRVTAQKTTTLNNVTLGIAYSASDLQEEEAYRELEAGFFDLALMKYERILTYEPNNSTANAVVAIGQLTKIIEHPKIREIVQAWESRLNVDMGFPTSFHDWSQSGFKNNSNLIDVTLAISLSEPATLNMITRDTQDLIENALLPQIDQAIVHLNRLTDGPDFTFILSKRLTLLRSGSEFDKGEAYALKSILHLTRALFSQMAAYDISVSPTSGKSLSAVLTSSPKFGTLRTNGRTRMTETLSNLQKMTDSVIDGIRYIQAESDTQSNDIIKLPANLSSVLTDLDTLKRSLSGETVTVQFDNPGDATQKVSLDVNLANFYKNPITDIRDYMGIHAVNGELTAESFRDGFDFTLQGLFPGLKTFQHWKDYKFFGFPVFQPEKSYNFFDKQAGGFNPGKLLKKGNSLFVVDFRYGGGIQAFDVSGEITKVGGYNSSSSPVESMDIAGNSLYVQTYWGDQKVLNISDPTNITLISSGYAYDSGWKIENNLLYTIREEYSSTTWSYRDKLKISNFSSSSPVASIELPALGNYGYTYYTGKIAVDNGLAYVLRRNGNPDWYLDIVNISNSATPSLVSHSLLGNLGWGSINKLTAAGNHLAFSMSDYGNRLIIVDVSNSAAPVKIVDKTYSGDFGFALSASTLYVATDKAFTEYSGLGLPNLVAAKERKLLTPVTFGGASYYYGGQTKDILLDGDKAYVSMNDYIYSVTIGQ